MLNWVKTMNVPFIDLKREYKLLQPKIDSVLREVAAGGEFILGERVANFEKNISQYLVSRSLGCASGSDALLLSLMALNIGNSDEVVTTPFSFAATAMVIARLGARPVFVDIEENTYNINPRLIEKAITKNTKAIIVVHLFGNPVDMKPILKIAKKHKIAVIEDACQAIGAEYYGEKVGTIGDFGCFSFFPTKNLGGYGDGGLVICKKKNHYDLLKKLRVNGAEKKYRHEIIGINSRLDAIQAAILDLKILHLDEWNKKRLELAKRYNLFLKNFVTKQSTPKGGKHVFHQYAVLAKNRNKFLNYLKKEGVNAVVCYPLPFHLQKCFSYLGYKRGDFPVAEIVSDTIISLPIFPFMTKKEIDYVIRVFNGFKN